jgi:hypothetical protein
MGESGNGQAAQEEGETDSSARLGREMRGEAASSEGANQKGKRIPVKTRPMRGLGGPAGAVSACGAARPVGWLGQRPSRPQGWPGRKYEKRISELKIWIFEFTKALEIYRRRFRRNFDMRIFPKFF